MICRDCRCPVNDRVREVAKARAAVAVKKDGVNHHQKTHVELVQVHRQMVVVDCPSSAANAALRTIGFIIVLSGCAGDFMLIVFHLIATKTIVC